MNSLIIKKRDGANLSEEEISFIIRGCVNNDIPDYQLSAFLMAVYFKGMSDTETAYLTKAMAESGDMLDLSSVDGFKIDKHSTGGVGDKTTLIVAPMAAACGLKVAKMSGRGLGFTGGTVDKLESISGYRTTLSREEFLKTVDEIGCSLIGQSDGLVPADKKLYALRDVTGTVESIPLIASSIMSKKLAAGADGFVIDIKVGNGAFMKTKKEAEQLSNEMINIARAADKKIRTVITDMNTPLGNNIGNSLEVIEAIEVLKGGGPEDLKKLCIDLCAEMLVLANKGSIEECKIFSENSITSGKAFEIFCKMVERHGGDVNLISDTDKFSKAKYVKIIKSQKTGILTKLDAITCGLAACTLGAGRNKKDDVISPAAGIVLNKKIGDRVCNNECIATLYTDNEKFLYPAEVVFETGIDLN